MNRRTLALIAALLCSVNVAKADYAFTVGAGQAAFSFTASTGGTALCAASVTHCFATVPINTAGAAFFTSGAPGLVTLTGTNNIATVTTITGVTTVSTVTALTTLTGGAVASGAADSGNPLKVGCKYNATPVTLTDGNRGDCQADVNGYAKVNVTNANVNVANNADAVAAGAGCCSPVTNYGYVWNGSTWDRQAGTTAGTKITAASASIASGAYASGSLASGAVVDITNISATTAGAVPSKAIYGGVNVSGNIVGVVGDPCQTNAHSYQPISQTTSTQLFAGTSSKKTYVCHIYVQANAAESANLVSGTGTVCATSPHAMIGPASVTALTAISANSGFSLGTGGYAIAASTTNADNVCLVQLGTVQLTGVISYVSQ